MPSTTAMVAQVFAAAGAPSEVAARAEAPAAGDLLQVIERDLRAAGQWRDTAPDPDLAALGRAIASAGPLLTARQYAALDRAWERTRAEQARPQVQRARRAPRRAAKKPAASADGDPEPPGGVRVVLEYADADDPATVDRVVAALAALLDEVAS